MRSEAPDRAFELADIARTELRDLLDLQLSPLGLCAIEALGPRPGEVIVDVGCGCGETTLQLAQAVGPLGRVIGVDIAPRSLAAARERAAGLSQARFVEADAAALDLPAASVDGIYSRFGVMTFADPVAAFRHFRWMLKPGGSLAFVCWRALAENELERLPLVAAGLGTMVDPAPFSFADPARIATILEAAGFEAMECRPHDAVVSSGGLEAMVEVLLRVGALGRILRDRPQLRGDAEPRLRAALAAKARGGAVGLAAATWIVTARRG
jgi:SAM-dependent methyltransferase